MTQLEAYLTSHKGQLSSYILDGTNAFKNDNQKLIELASIAALHCLRKVLGLNFDLKKSLFYSAPRHEAYNEDKPYADIGPPEAKTQMKRLKSGEIELSSVKPFGNVNFDIYVLFQKSDTFKIGGTPHVYETGEKYTKMLWDFPKNKSLPLGFYYTLKRLLPTGLPEAYYSLAQEGHVEFLDLVNIFAHEFTHLFQDIRARAIVAKSRDEHGSFQKLFSTESDVMDMYNEAVANMVGIDSLLYFLQEFGGLMPDDYSFELENGTVTWGQIKKVQLAQFKDQLLGGVNEATAWRYSITDNFFKLRESLGERIFDKTLNELVKENLGQWRFTRAAFNWPGTLKGLLGLNGKGNSPETWGQVGSVLLQNARRT